MSTIDEVKSRIDIVELVSEAGVKLRHAGRNYTGFCPFHDNKHTPAFVVWPETGTWRCFGQCNEGGDIFKFVMKREGIDFKEALKKLAARAGVELKDFQRETPEQREAYDHLRKLLEDAVVFYRSHLFNNRDILTYLREKRGLTDASIETFGLGFAPQGFDNALSFFTQRGYSEQDLMDAGLVTERDDGRRYDRFRNRIMIPIRDEQGRMAGFGARIVDPDDIPKFLNSPETPIFNKGRLLYGLGPRPQTHPRRRSGGDRGRLPRRDRFAPGGLRKRHLADGHRVDRGSTAPAQTLHPPHRPRARPGYGRTESRPARTRSRPLRDGQGRRTRLRRARFAPQRIPFAGGFARGVHARRPRPG
ncbi:MAG: hypothetical protein HND47_02110 [Chloroflexi bacterium]|nr:hypothetical protein [Chloroflexota bacterium]